MQNNVYMYDKTKLIPIFVIFLLVGSSLGFYFAGFNGNNVSFPFWEYHSKSPIVLWVAITISPVIGIIVGEYILKRIKLNQIMT